MTLFGEGANMARKSKVGHQLECIYDKSNKMSNVSAFTAMSVGRLGVLAYGCIEI